MISKYLDYKRRKELDAQAQFLWRQCLLMRGESSTTEAAIQHAHKTLAAFYDAFYPNHKS